MVRKVRMQEVVAKTGHDMRGARESAVRECMNGDDLLLSYGSAALAGWVNPYNQIYPPTLRIVISDDTLRIVVYPMSLKISLLRLN
jgi:hypothetical protein